MKIAVAVMFCVSRDEPVLGQVEDADEERDQDDPRQRDEVRDVERIMRPRLVQVAVDALGERPADAFHLGDVVDAAACTPRRPPKCSSSAWRRLAPMPGISFSIEVVRVLPRRARCPMIAKRCASSRICWIRCSPGCDGASSQAARLRLEDQLLHARLALRALGHADDAHLVQAQISSSTARRYADLALAAVDQDEVGDLAALRRSRAA